jgi:hypothetical protein
MDIQSGNSRGRNTNSLAIVSFGLGILAIFPPVFLALGLFAPHLVSVPLSTAYDGYPKTVFDHYLCCGSISCGLASLITGIIASILIKISGRDKGEILAILAIVFGLLGLIYSVFFIIHIWGEPMIYSALQ